MNLLETVFIASALDDTNNNANTLAAKEEKESELREESRLLKTSKDESVRDLALYKEAAANKLHAEIEEQKKKNTHIAVAVIIISILLLIMVDIYIGYITTL